MHATPFTLSDILTRLMFEHKIRPAELARRINLPQPTIQRLAAGTTTRPNRGTLEAVARFFSITVSQLTGIEPIPGLSQQHFKQLHPCVPLLTWSQAVNADKALKVTHENWILTDAKVGPRAFALAMKDASMEPQFFKDTILVFDPDVIPRDRSFVVVRLHQCLEVVFRQLVIDEPEHFLKPLSLDFQMFAMKVLKPEDQIVGVLVQARRDYNINNEDQYGF